MNTELKQVFWSRKNRSKKCRIEFEKEQKKSSATAKHRADQSDGKICGESELGLDVER